jgi:hypothetical protein
VLAVRVVVFVKLIEPADPGGPTHKRAAEGVIEHANTIARERVFCGHFNLEWSGEKEGERMNCRELVRRQISRRSLSSVRSEVRVHLANRIAGILCLAMLYHIEQNCQVE